MKGVENLGSLRLGACKEGCKAVNPTWEVAKSSFICIVHRNEVRNYEQMNILEDCQMKEDSQVTKGFNPAGMYDCHSSRF